MMASYAAVTLLLVVHHTLATSEHCFRAAVVEYAPSNVLSDNLMEFDRIAQLASGNDAKIIVFPENGLFQPPPTR